MAAIGMEGLSDFSALVHRQSGLLVDVRPAREGQAEWRIYRVLPPKTRNSERKPAYDMRGAAPGRTLTSTHD